MFLLVLPVVLSSVSAVLVPAPAAAPALTLGWSDLLASQKMVKQP